MTYFAKYHELCVSGDSAKLEAILNTMSYSHAYLTASLLKFLASQMTDQERRVRLQKIIRTIQAHLEQDFPPLLVCLNIDGTIALRTKNKISQAEYVIQPRVKKIDEKYIYFRSGVEPFLKDLMRHPRVRLAFYSSTPEYNIDWFLCELLRNDLGFLFERAIGAFDHRSCTSTGSVLDLNKIWQSDCLAKHKEKSGEKFDESNTILIDKEEIGVINHQENALILKKFEEADVKIQTELD